MKFVKLLQREKDLQRAVQIFKDPNASPEEIEKVGEQFLLLLYGAKNCESLNKYRYHCFVQSITKSLPNLASLPPTKDAARLHSFRTYNQIQQWYGNEKSALDWGWRNSKNGLMPIPTLQDAAPQELLKLISCKCAKGCNVACSCRKAGLHCSIMCGFCQGKSCSNTVDVDELDDDEDLDIEIENAIERSEDYQPNPEYETDVVESQDDIEAYIEQPSTSKRRRKFDEPSTSK